MVRKILKIHEISHSPRYIKTEVKLRVSFIEFLNAVPLGWSFLEGPDEDAFDLLFDVPSVCAHRLACGEADVGLIPVIEYHNIAGLQVLPDIAIASKRDVRSVLFVSKVPIEKVSRVILDPSSRTSVVLLKILLHQFYRQSDVDYVVSSADPFSMRAEADAALLIGNRALKTPTENLFVYDLAREWNRFTGLPFVFAFWAVRDGVRLGHLQEVFYRSRDLGLQQVDQVAALYSQKLGLSPESIRYYILRNLSYTLGEKDLLGLRRFYELAFQLKLIPRLRSLRFYRDPVMKRVGREE